ncbi:response regulator [Polaromonas sp. P1(28)-8]|nr:response regulator [Polaromonas sp. P1(28)-8]
MKERSGNAPRGAAGPHEEKPAGALLSPLIHLIDDDEAVRSSLALLISTVGLRVQSWSDPQAFISGFDRQGIGAIVLDVRMPGISGLAVLDTLMAQGVDQPVIMLTGHGTVDMCRRAFKSGAAEFLEKPVNDEQLLEALQNAVRQHVKSRERRQTDRQAQERFAQLSEREREVLGLIVAGLTNKEIGRALAVSPRTVETHRANLFAKLEAESLAQLIRQYATLADEADGR